ncbi:MAG: hypothetical protein JJU29_09235 [Verrucomicrobia bacterium]|nr:hypothetical protein [Verrucomicrobiota bacterium]MCH8513146.1 hypothetical protein [Kiritimatiellia bacterium]
MIQHIRNLLLTLMGVATLSAHADLNRTSATPVHVLLTLDNALFDGDEEDHKTLILDLEWRHGVWGEVYGVARDYNMSFHRGSVISATQSGDEINIHVGMRFGSDPWKPGGQGEYRIRLTRNEQGDYEGEFEGEFNTRPRSGKVNAQLYAPKVAEDHVPLEIGEFPRLLFRKSDLPALREKLQTPFGQAALERMKRSDHPVTQGVMYQLTGEVEYAEKAIAEAELYLAGKSRESGAFRHLAPLGERMEVLAQVYDLCQDVMSDDYKARYRAWAADLNFQMYFAPVSLGRTNWHVVSNHVADLYAAMTKTGLVLHDVPSEEPAPPFEPFLEEVLPPAENFTPADGVPVVDLTPGRSPAKWIHTELMRRNTPDDPRQVFYGLEKVNPQPGTQVKVGDFEMTFQEQISETVVADDDTIGGFHVGPLLKADAAARLAEPLTMVLHTVVRVTEPGTYVIINPSSRANLAQLSLAGQLIDNEQVVRLEEGLYPLTVMVQWRMKWGHIAPTISKANDGHIAKWQQQAENLRSDYQTRMSGYQTVRDAWERSGGADPTYARMLRLARFTSALHNQAAVGRGGFQGEVGTYSLEAMLGHARLWTAWRKVMGYDITPGNEYADVIPRKLVGGPQDINGTTRIGLPYFAALFSAIRPEWQPEVLTAWNRDAKVTDTGFGELFGGDLARTFVNYPAEMDPAPLGTNLPLFWEAPDFGYYALRTGWGEKDFIAQVFLKSQSIQGWNGPNAGTYRLRGLGQDWAVGPTDRVRRREQENVVFMPESDLAAGARGHLTHLEQGDKTMVLSVDLNETYERQGRYHITRYGQIRYLNRNPETRSEPSGITGSRSIAFDFSGLSGAPALYAVVDRIEGGEDEPRLWLYQPPLERGQSVAQVVKPVDSGFVARSRENGPSLHGRFAHPASPKVNTNPLSYIYEKNWGNNRGRHEIQVNAVHVPGTDHFVFIATITEGEYPEITVSGQGLDAVFTVGRRVISFDGENLVLGEKP